MFFFASLILFSYILPWSFGYTNAFGVDGSETISKQIHSNLDSLGTTTLNNNIGSLGILRKVKVRDKVTGNMREVEVRVADQNKKSGETVLRARGFIIKLDDLIKK